MHFVQQVRRCTREICYHSPPVFTLSRALNVSESRSRKIAGSTSIRDLLPSRTLVKTKSHAPNPSPNLKRVDEYFISFSFDICCSSSLAETVDHLIAKKKEKKREKCLFPLFFFQLHLDENLFAGLRGTTKESSEESKIKNLTRRDITRSKRKFTFLVLFVPPFLYPIPPTNFPSSHSPILFDVFLFSAHRYYSFPEKLFEKKKKKEKRIEKDGASFERRTNDQALFFSSGPEV